MVRSGRGRIILIGSSVAHDGGGGTIDYAMAKAGLDGMMKYLARQYTRNTRRTSPYWQPTWPVPGAISSGAEALYRTVQAMCHCFRLAEELDQANVEQLLRDGQHLEAMRILGDRIGWQTGVLLPTR